MVAIHLKLFLLWVAQALALKDGAEIITDLEKFPAAMCEILQT
ncbi:MAG TPA: hypothetical protein VKK79_08525 [Candidatus Lokiarchaeia archaeon]|nr:hypothetical protein [Candidatus Lokiarchaeia archaeon]